MNTATDDLSRIFTRYNQQRNPARAAGAASVERRANRALGLAQSPERLAAAIDRYGTTSDTCGCPDARYTGLACKHMRSLWLTGPTNAEGTAVARRSEAQLLEELGF